MPNHAGIESCFGYASGQHHVPEAEICFSFSYGRLTAVLTLASTSVSPIVTRENHGGGRESVQLIKDYHAREHCIEMNETESSRLRFLSLYYPREKHRPLCRNATGDH